jgi:hypothetical protein
MKLTEWYPGNVNPVRFGVYERDFSGGAGPRIVGFALWTGSRWSFSSPTPRDAMRQRFMSSQNNLPWRGLAEKP